MSEHYDLFDGEVALWIEQGAVHLKAVDPYGDPIELTSEMSKELAEKLRELAAIVDAL